ncbi:c-type cytochrome biogenesis protein CcmI, partial [Natronospira sp.]
MMTFVTLSALLVVAALLLAAGPLIRRRGGKVSREAVDAVAVTRARQLAELEQELEDGDIDNRTYELSRRQIESEASDRQADAESGPAIQTGKPVSAIVLAVLLPLATLGIYLQVGDPDAIDRGSMNPMAGGDMDMAAAVDALESRLAQQPDDLEGWMLLGRSRISLGQYDQAVEAYRQAVEIAGEDNPRVLANYAEAITLADPSRMVTHAAPLFRHVLDLDPSHPKGLWYGGLITMEEGDPESAVAL